MATARAAVASTVLHVVPVARYQYMGMVSSVKSLGSLGVTRTPPAVPVVTSFWMRIRVSLVVRAWACVVAATTRSAAAVVRARFNIAAPRLLDTREISAT